MSQAKPKGNDERRTTYLRDRAELTPAQERRLRHKGNQATSERVLAGVGRHGRLGRRFDRKDQREVKRRAAAAVAFIRSRIAANRGGQS